MLGGSQVGLRALTRRWWAPVRATLTEQGLADRPIYFVSSNPHSLVNLVTATARARARTTIVALRRGAAGRTTCARSSSASATGRTEGSWENFLYYGARLLLGGAARGRRRPGSAGGQHERELGVTHISSRTGAARVRRR